MAIWESPGVQAKTLENEASKSFSRLGCLARGFAWGLTQPSTGGYTHSAQHHKNVRIDALLPHRSQGRS